MNKIIRHSTLLALMGFASTAVLAAPLMSATEAKTQQNAPAIVKQSQAAHMARINENYGKMPIAFEPNVGQTSKAVKYMSRGKGYNLWLTDTAAVLALQPAHGKKADVLRMKFLGAQKPQIVAGLDKLPGKTNYFVGDKSKWHSNVDNFSRVQYKELYKGVDLAFHGDQRQMEYDFIVNPGADYKQVALGFDGVKSLHLNKAGELVLKTAQGELIQHKPVIYQMQGGKRQFVAGNYVLKGKNKVGFEVARYDASKPLVIDPTLSYQSYFGGTGLDTGNGITVDKSGNAYIVGTTQSSDFPGVTGGTASATNNDAFIVKISPTGTRSYVTVFGGTGNESGNGIALDSAGNAYIDGTTDGTLPVAGTAMNGTKSQGTDGYVARFDPTGALNYDTYVGGNGDDLLNGIAVDSAGNVYVTGATSSNTSFVKTSGTVIGVPYTGSSTVPNALTAFMAKMNLTANTLNYLTYFGNASTATGSGNTFAQGRSVAVDSNGNAYVTGYATAADPTTSPAPAQAFAPGTDGFVAKFNTAVAGTASLLYQTYLGDGTNVTDSRSIAIDGTGVAYVAGISASPTIMGAAPIVNNAGGNDAFVAKIDTTKTGTASLGYSTFIGGPGNDEAHGIVVNGGNAFVTGLTSGLTPTTGALNSTITGTQDAFMAQLASTGSAAYASYINNTDLANGIAILGSSSGATTGTVYVVGTSTPGGSAATPASTTGLGGGDAFAAAISGFPYTAATSSTTSGGTGSSGGGSGSGTPTPTPTTNPAPATDNGGGGGCVYSPASSSGDLALPGLAALSVLYLLRRRYGKKA